MSTFKELYFEAVNITLDERLEVFEKFRYEVLETSGSDEANFLVGFAPSCAETLPWEDNPRDGGPTLFRLMKEVYGPSQRWDFLRTVIQQSGHERRYLVRGIVAARTKFAGKMKVPAEVEQALFQWSKDQLQRMVEVDHISTTGAKLCIRLTGQFGGDEGKTVLQEFEKSLDEYQHELTSVRQLLERTMSQFV